VGWTELGMPGWENKGRSLNNTQSERTGFGVGEKKKKNKETEREWGQCTHFRLRGEVKQREKSKKWKYEEIGGDTWETKWRGSP